MKNAVLPNEDIICNRIKRIIVTCHNRCCNSCKHSAVIPLNSASTALAVDYCRVVQGDGCRINRSGHIHAALSHYHATPADVAVACWLGRPAALVMCPDSFCPCG